MLENIAVVGARVTTMVITINGIISKINNLQQQMGSLASSDTTNEMLLVLDTLKQTLQDVMDTYLAVMSNKPIAYRRKYAGKSAVTGVTEAISSIQQALALAEAWNKNRTNHADDEYAVVYKIQPGDTLSELAKKYNVSVDELCRLNNIKNRNLIRAGADLLIPISLPAGMALSMTISGIPLKHIGNNSSAANTSSASNSNAAKNGATSATNSGKANNSANTAPATPTQNTTTSGTGNFTVTQTGDKTVYCHNEKTQSQYGEYSKISFEKVWKNGTQKSDGDTIGSSGCGPTAFSSCINALNGNNDTNPRTMCKYAQDCHARSAEADGTVMETLFSEWCKDHPEYHYKTICDSRPNNSQIASLVEALKQGKVGTLGTNHNSSSDKNIFAGAQHIVAVTGVEESENGIRLIISDPGAFNGDKLNSTYNGRCVKTGRVEMIGDKTYVDLDVAAKYITSIRIISK